MNNFELSKYNLLVASGNNSLAIFNTYTGSVTIVNGVNKGEFEQLINENKKELVTECANVYEELKKNGVIIEKGYDEFGALKMMFRGWRYNKQILGLVIAPNLDCNFRCKYCYEDLKKEYMSEDVVSAIEKYVMKINEETKLQSLRISWYGGEPLLSFDIIKKLSERFLKVCNDYSALIFTNGYLLDEKKISLLSELKIDKLHITIDGSPITHDKRRVTIGGKGTYTKIKQNIVSIIEKYSGKIRIIMRSNLDKHNIEDYLTLLEDFRPYKDHISFSYFRTSCSTGASQNYCGTYDYKEFEKETKDIESYMYENGYRDLKKILPVRSTAHHCYVGHINGIAIAPNGNVYKCFGELNPPGSPIGILTREGSITYNYPTYYRWNDIDPFDDPRCCKCDILPICMGNCAAGRLKLNYEIQPCTDRLKSEYRNYIIDKVRKYLKETKNLSKVQE